MQPNVLLLSQRSIANLVAFGLSYEFEDTVAGVTDARRIDPPDRDALEFSRRAYRLARMATGSLERAWRFTPRPKGVVDLDREYDLFFPMFSHAYQMLALAAVPNWRSRSRKAACFITEFYTDKVSPYLIEIMGQFDHVFLGFKNSIEEVSRITGKPCSYLPLASDVLRFAPATAAGPRPIELCNIGRRSAVTHQALLEDAQRRGSFYYYDTVAASGMDLKDRTFRVENHAEHRQMLATILRNSSYFIANRSYVNQPEFDFGGDEISSRFYEGAAAGTVMIGEAPRTAEFQGQFDWPDAVTHVPFDSPDVCEILAELNANPERLRRIRRDNIREAARRHDWLHRIQVVFDALGLDATEAMRVRAQRLNQIASEVPVS